MDVFFKTSKLSICHKCVNVKEACSMVSKSCGTDSKLGQSFVSSCSLFNKEFAEKSYNKNTVSVSHSPDSRQESMGGGFHLVEKYKNGDD